MKDEDKTNEQLISELLEVRQRVAELEASENDHKRTEKVLKESEKHFRSLFESTTEGIITTDYEGRIVVTNLAAAKILGYGEPENLVGLSTIELYADSAQRKKVFAELMEKGFVHSYELVFKKKDGTLITCLGSATIFKDEDGKIKRVEGIFTDITERRKMETALKKMHQELENKVEERTANLKIANEQLQQEITERNRAEEELWKIKEKFSSLVTNIPGVVYRCACDQDWTMEFISDEIKMLSGYPASDFMKNAARSYASIIHPDDRQMVEDSVLNGVNHNLPYTIEYRVIHRDDSTHWVYESGKATKDTSGGVTCLDGAIFDITERKQAEGKLLESQEQARAILNAPFDALFISDTNGTILDCNEAFLQRFNKNADEVQGSCIWNLLPPELTQSRQAMANKVIQTGKPLRFQDCRQDKWLDSIVYPILDKQGNVANLAVFSRDITEIKQAEEALRKIHAYLDNVIESSLDSIVVTDKMGYIARVNKAFPQLLGLEEKEIIGKHMSELSPTKEGVYESTTGESIQINEAFFDLVKTSIARFVKKGMMQNAVGYHIRKDNKLVPVENNIVFLYDKDGERTGAVGIIRDITERKNAEKQLIEYQNQLKSLASQMTLTEEKERKRLADHLHDQIGQKLFISKLKLEVLNKSLSSADNTKALGEICEIIHQMIKDTRSLTSEISPPMLYQFGLEAALERFTEQASEQYGFMIDFEDDEQEKELSDDLKILLFQAVRELLMNVLKHARTQNAKVSVQRDNTHIKICVEDDGVGFTLPSGSFSKGSNQGFGLFSIRERLDHLGGQFEIKSQPDCGTQATLVAPLKDKKEI